MKKNFTPEFVYPIGTRLKLASGSPMLVVVDNDKNLSTVTVSWVDDEGVEQEVQLPSVCFDIFRRTHYI